MLLGMTWTLFAFQSQGDYQLGEEIGRVRVLRASTLTTIKSQPISIYLFKECNLLR